MRKPLPVGERPRLAVPTVAAVIATYNRAQQLRVCLQALTEQTRPPDQILVIDDGSPDETGALVAREFPSMTYVRLPRNQGYIYARNLGLASARADYVLLLDDDSWFVAPDALAKSVDLAASLADVGAFAFNVVEAAGPPLFDVRSPSREVATFVGCGGLLKRTAVEEAGYFTEDLNAVLRELLRCPAFWLPHCALRTRLSQTRYNLRNGYWAADLRVLANLPVILGVMFRRRHSVGRAAYRSWRRLRRGGNATCRAART